MVPAAGGTRRTRRTGNASDRAPRAFPDPPRLVVERLGRLRRPVLMTSAATVFGHFPLVLVTGPGSEARNSIGTVLVAGMTIGTLFTLFVVPVFYSLLAADHHQKVEDKVIGDEALANT